MFGAYCRAVASDDAVLRLLAGMPERQWQPNLLVGAVRHLAGTPGSGAAFLEVVHSRSAEIAEVMASHSTQTNEPARCATLLPALARLPGPLALIEVGASAGLCLLPDHYAYAYGERAVPPSVDAGVGAPSFACAASESTPVPSCGVAVAWRAGLDLDPVDVDDDARWRWLEALVWPGNDDRVARLRAAREVARRVRPRVVRGDLRSSELRALAAQAPPDATLVVFHSAVLAYMPDRSARAAFAEEVAELGAVWIANEAPGYIPGVSSEVAKSRPSETCFLLAVDGHPTAWTHGWGAWITWIE